MAGQFALKFISGKYQGGEFPLPDKGEVVIGRASELGMVLVEDMVSRRHAKIVIDGKRIGILDLGSTNGTFVNGEKVSKMELHLGDRVLIGTSILRVMPASDMSARQSQLSGDELRSMMEDLAKAHASDTTMSGELEEVPFPDLVQLFASNKKSGVLVITGANEGSIYLRDGQLIFAHIGANIGAQIGPQTMPPIKAFGRMVQWSSGHFELKALGDVNFSSTIRESTESVLLEALRQFDEMRRIQRSLPKPDSMIVIARPMRARLRELSADDLDRLQVFLEASTFQEALDNFAGTDFEAVSHYKRFADLGLIMTM